MTRLEYIALFQDQKYEESITKPVANSDHYSNKQGTKHSLTPLFGPEHDNASNVPPSGVPTNSHKLLGAPGTPTNYCGSS